jgi:hypothetical protein
MLVQPPGQQPILTEVHLKESMVFRLILSPY